MNNKKSVIALLLVAIIGIVGLTLAYFANSTDVENTFTTKEYGTTYTEEFVSPDNWLPGDTTNKTIVATNTGQVDQAVRIHVSEAWTTHNDGTLNGWIHTDGTKSNHTTETELANDERVAILNLANASDWTKVGDYYYYNYKLAPGESTTSFLESVTFNPKTKLDDTCTTTTNNGVTTTTCNSSGDDYDNATYTLTFTIETVQYNKFASAWNTGNTVTIAEERQLETFAQHIINKSNALSVTNYTDGITTEAYTFNHAATEQTGALTDYRYIGNNPNNYVYFNCTDESDTSTCETWRIIGVFNVDDGTGNFENRVKLVSNSGFSRRFEENNDNDWSTSVAKEYLNNEYYTSLSDNSKLMIDNAKYYLGSQTWINDTLGTPEEIYNWERSNTVCASCNYDDEKKSWIGKIALMYPSDQYLVYGKNVDSTCYDNPMYCSNDSIAKTGWIYNSNTNTNGLYIEKVRFLSVNSADTFFNFCSETDGHFEYSCSIVESDLYLTRPTIYLKTNTFIVDGDGSSTTPYKIELR